MKKRIISLLLLILVISPLCLFAEDFVINHYNIDVEVFENNSYKITETIDVNFTYERHGLFRTIPTTFNQKPVVIKDISVPGFKSRVQRSKYDVRITIGSRFKTVYGPETYTISYLLDVGDDGNPDMDEFYLNLIGNQWDTTMDYVDFTIRMPRDFDESRLNITSGYLGDTNNTNVEWSVDGRTITGHSLKPFFEHEALTAALPLPEGYWQNAVAHQERGALLFDIIGYPLDVLVILLPFFLWFMFGRDRQLFSAVEFYAPEGLPPADIGYLFDGVVNLKDMTSMVLYWADKGYLTLKEVDAEKGTDKTLEITKIRELGPEAKEYEHRMFNELFNLGGGRSVTMEEFGRNFNSVIDDAKDLIYEEYEENPEKVIFENRKGLKLFTGFLAILPLTAFMFQTAFRAANDRTELIVIVLAFSIPNLVIYFLTALAVGRGAGLRKRWAVTTTIIISVIFTIVTTLLIAVIGETSLLNYFASVISTFLGALFTFAITKRTEYGDRMLEKCLGFRDFIKNAEKDRLETLFDSNPSYFFNILPYAMAMDLSEKWSEHFEGFQVSSPGWYEDSTTMNKKFTLNTFTRNLNKNFVSVGSSSSSSSFSGSSGGGFSSSSGGSAGGGAGGGGGGSW